MVAAYIALGTGGIVSLLAGLYMMNLEKDGWGWMIFVALIIFYMIGQIAYKQVGGKDEDEA